MKTNVSNLRTHVTSLITALVFLFAAVSAGAQTQKPKLTVLNIDAQGINLTPEQLGNIVRIEVDKLDTFQVTDRYDVAYLLKKHNLDLSNCYGKICLVEYGKIIGTDYILGGSVEKYAETIIITLRLIDVNKDAIAKTYIREFLNLPLEIQTMFKVSVRELFGLANDPALLQQLTKEFNYETMINNPNKSKVNLSGTRFGMVFYSGETAKILKAPTQSGGFDKIPMMFQFGWQFEKQYLNEGNYQALVEFLPLITGLDQGMFIPSMTILHGLRNNRIGVEFAFGPTINIVKKAKGYYENGTWHQQNEWLDVIPNPNPIVTRMDSRGNYYLQSSFVLAAGWTMKSGRLNIPINAFFIPSNDGARFGFSMGFNAKKD